MKATPINDMFVKNGKIRQDGLHVHDMRLVPGEGAKKDSKAPWDYYKQLSVIPGDQAFQALSASRCPLVNRA